MPNAFVATNTIKTAWQRRASRVRIIEHQLRWVHQDMPHKNSSASFVKQGCVRQKCELDVPG